MIGACTIEVSKGALRQGNIMLKMERDIGQVVGKGQQAHNNVSNHVVHAPWFCGRVWGICSGADKASIIYYLW